MKNKPTECQVMRYLRAGYTHWIAFETDLGINEEPFVVEVGFPTTESTVGNHLKRFQDKNAKSYLLKELYATN